MQQENGFYICVPSNDTSRRDNRANHFRVRLASSIDLSGGGGAWEVALTELICSGLTTYTIDDNKDFLLKIPFLIDFDKVVGNSLLPFSEFVESTSLKRRTGPIVKWETSVDADDDGKAHWTLTNWEIGTIKLQLPQILCNLLHIKSYRVGVPDDMPEVVNATEEHRKAHLVLVRVQMELTEARVQAREATKRSETANTRAAEATDRLAASSAESSKTSAGEAAVQGEAEAAKRAADQAKEVKERAKSAQVAAESKFAEATRKANLAKAALIATRWKKTSRVEGASTATGTNNLTLFLYPRCTVQFTFNWLSARQTMRQGDKLEEEFMKHLPLFITCTLVKEVNSEAKLSMKQLLNQHLYVYTNIVRYQVVGNSQLPLLRIVDAKNLEHQSTFANPYYLPVSVKELNEIGCFLYNSRGELIDFNPGGRTVAVLHFRQATGL
jgi:hypothetical protein